MSHLSSDLCCYLQPLFILTTYRYIQGNKGILNITLLFLFKYHLILDFQPHFYISHLPVMAWMAGVFMVWTQTQTKKKRNRIFNKKQAVYFGPISKMEKKAKYTGTKLNWEQVNYYDN